MTERDGVSLSALADQIAELRQRTEEAQQTVSHLRASLTVLEMEMLRRQQPPEDWE